MTSPHLYHVGDRLSLAELTAACLDGHLVEVGEAYMPADAVETAALRAGSLATILGRKLAATHLSAAWIHGALPDPPARHTVQRASPTRLHHVIDRRLVYRDLQVAPEDLLRIGGSLVTTPERTLADLARQSDAAHLRAAQQMVASGIASAGDAIGWLRTHGRRPHKRDALALLARLDSRETFQDEETRYTS